MEQSISNESTAVCTVAVACPKGGVTLAKVRHINYSNFFFVRWHRAEKFSTLSQTVPSLCSSMT